MLIRQIILVLLGLFSGFTVSAGVFAFITMLGIIPRLASRTNTAKHIYLYENAIIWGGTLGNMWVLSGIHLPLSVVFLCILGLCSGIFVGCLAMALAEMLRVIPIMINRIQLLEGFPIVVAAIAVGKLCGSLFQFFVV